jgi:hypothetical protein
VNRLGLLTATATDARGNASWGRPAVHLVVNTTLSVLTLLHGIHRSIKPGFPRSIEVTGDAIALASVATNGAVIGTASPRQSCGRLMHVTPCSSGNISERARLLTRQEMSRRHTHLQTRQVLRLCLHKRRLVSSQTSQLASESCINNKYNRAPHFSLGNRLLIFIC